MRPFFLPGGYLVPSWCLVFTWCLPGAELVPSCGRAFVVKHGRPRDAIGGPKRTAARTVAHEPCAANRATRFSNRAIRAVARGPCSKKLLGPTVGSRQSNPELSAERRASRAQGHGCLGRVKVQVFDKQ